MLDSATLAGLVATLRFPAARGLPSRRAQGLPQDADPIGPMPDDSPDGSTETGSHDPDVLALSVARHRPA